MSAEVISRLCAACGMCCNGVMFHRVELQPADSAKELAALGLRLRYKKKQHSILQPCPAHAGNSCRIYLERPERCRIFTCRQLAQVLNGEILEAVARGKIEIAQQLISRLKGLFDQSGAKNDKKPFIVRYEAAISQPMDASSSSTDLAVRQQLIETFAELEKLLAEHFRGDSRS